MSMTQITLGEMSGDVTLSRSPVISISKPSGTTSFSINDALGEIAVAFMRSGSYSIAEDKDGCYWDYGSGATWRSDLGGIVQNGANVTFVVPTSDALTLQLYYWYKS